MSTETATRERSIEPAQIERMAAAIDPFPESDDAAQLAAALAKGLGADLMLLAVEPELPLLMPGGNWRRMRHETERMLAQSRNAHAPRARTAIDVDLSVPHGLRRLLERQHRQLVVVGSSRQGPAGVVSVGHKTRQLLDHLPCALAIAPRGWSTRPGVSLTRIGVGFDGHPESEAALAVAAALATGTGGELVLRGAIDDRIPALGWPDVWRGTIMQSWQEVMDDESQALHKGIEAATASLSMPVHIQVTRDRPAVSLQQFSSEIDLLVIGSRRWGPVAHLLMGGTGEALVRGARCPLLIVPRPHRTAETS